MVQSQAGQSRAGQGKGRAGRGQGTIRTWQGQCTAYPVPALNTVEAGQAQAKAQGKLNRAYCGHVEIMRTVPEGEWKPGVMRMPSSTALYR